MAANFLTLKISDSRFSSYLWGDFSDSQKAIPVKSYNLGTPEESVTFEVCGNEEIAKPSFFKFIDSLFKVRSYVLILFPLFFILVKNASNTNLDIVSIVFATAAMKFLFGGLNIRNDVNDHLSGFDRVNLDLGQKPIRQGWISARDASRISNFCLLAGVLCGMPCVLLNPPLVYVVGSALVLALGGELVKKNSYKNRHIGEATLFALTGPLLVSGLQLSCGAPLDFEVLSFGILWGAGVLFLIQVNNFAHIMTSSQHGIQNTMTKLGFDLSQKFLIFCWSVFLFFWTAYQYNFHGDLSGWAATFVLYAYSVYLFRQLLHIKSPMGSGLRAVRSLAYKVFFSAVAIMFLQCLQRLGVS